MYIYTFYFISFEDEDEIGEYQYNKLDEVIEQAGIFANEPEIKCCVLVDTENNIIEKIGEGDIDPLNKVLKPEWGFGKIIK